MSSLRHYVHRRVHLERGQTEHRKNKLGHLEKHKDYVKRAKRYHLQESIISNLEEKARTSNAQEFNFKMINSKVQDDGTVLIKNANRAETNRIDKEINHINHRLNLLRKKVSKDLPVVSATFAPPKEDQEEIQSGQESPAKTPLRQKRSKPLTKKPATDHVYKDISGSLQQINKLKVMRDKLTERKKVVESKRKKVPIFKVQCSSPDAVAIHRFAPERKR